MEAVVGTIPGMRRVLLRASITPASSASPPITNGGTSNSSKGE
jgi:hypothetical protein